MKSNQATAGVRVMYVGTSPFIPSHGKGTILECYSDCCKVQFDSRVAVSYIKYASLRQLMEVGGVTTSRREVAIDSENRPQLNDGARLPSSLPNDSSKRKEYPVYSVLFGYFPAAMNALAHHSYKSNEKHNPGQPLQWSRGKSSDHADCILRHLQEGDYEGVLWRAAALLQLKLEEEGAPKAPLAT